MKKVYVIAWIDQQGRRLWVEGNSEKLNFSLYIKNAEQHLTRDAAVQRIQGLVNSYHPFFQIEPTWVRKLQGE
jgi:hypothetical protein